MLWLMFWAIFAVVNGKFFEYEGRCPKNFQTTASMNITGKYYAIAETNNGTTRNNIDIVFKPSTRRRPVFTEEFFKNSDSDENCEHHYFLLRKLNDGRYATLSFLAVSEIGTFGNYGSHVYFLSSGVTFICYEYRGGTEKLDRFYTKVSVLRREPEEFGSDQRQEVEDILRSNNLDFMIEYLSPIKQDNSCPTEE